MKNRRMRKWRGGNGRLGEGKGCKVYCDRAWPVKMELMLREEPFVCDTKEVLVLAVGIGMHGVLVVDKVILETFLMDETYHGPMVVMGYCCYEQDHQHRQQVG